MLEITNTVTGKKEIFTPLHDDKVFLYVCGITPYDLAHIGHGRVYVTFDLLYRTLTFLGYTVAYCRNFTDIDDKLINKADKVYGDKQRYKEIAEYNIARYHEDMTALNCLSPSYEPRVTDNIPAIIDFIQKLIDKGIAYEVDGDVYFSIDRFPNYGKLSKHKLEDLQAGARVELNDKKQDPLDFALWKGEAEGCFWKSPWGYGRPGWHIECSAMANKYLGSRIDIHAGGLDLVFPHHENEVAQTEGLFGKPFATYWMHNGLVRINEEKMSKSLGNFFTLRQVFEQFNPMVLRYYILTHHYRAPLEFSWEDLDAVQKSYKRLCRIFEHVAVYEKPLFAQEVTSSVVQRMVEFLCDDLNTPGMFGVLFENLPQVQQNPEEMKLLKTFMVTVLGLTLELLSEKEIVLTPEIQHLLQERESARQAKDWAKADAIRDQLKVLGYTVQDKRI